MRNSNPSQSSFDKYRYISYDDPISIESRSGEILRYKKTSFYQYLCSIYSN